jgi:hypothetical protein
MTSPHSPPSHIPGSFTTDCQASGTTWNLMQWPWLKMLKSWQLHLIRGDRGDRGDGASGAQCRLHWTRPGGRWQEPQQCQRQIWQSNLVDDLEFIQILYWFYTYIQCIYSFSSCFVISSFDFRCVPPIIIFQKIQDHPDLCLHGIAVLSFQQPRTQIWHDLAIYKTPRLPWNCQSVSVTAQEM